MNIETRKDNDTLTISLIGRLDTNTTPKLEQEVESLDGINNLVFDLEKLDYISSSGLRLILKCKKKINSTRIINCTSEIYDIFNMTGFSEMMEIDRAYREISIDNCEKIAEGFYGTIYRIDSETIVKVFKMPNALETIKRERELAKKAFVLGIPTAIAYDIVKVGDLYGAIFELINAEVSVDSIKTDEILDDFAKKCTSILKNMHEIDVKHGDFPSRKERVVGWLKDCKKYFTEDIYNKLMNLLDSIPESNHLLHCDFHVKNIMIQNGDLLIIDMDTLSIGHPIFEFSALYSVYIGFACVDKENTDKFLGLPLDITTRLFNKIIRYYYADKSESELEEIILKLKIISSIQILRIRTMFDESVSNMNKEEIEYCKNYLIENVDKFETLNY